MVFLTQKLIYTTNIWFSFVFDSVLEPDHILNLIVFGGYAKG